MSFQVIYSNIRNKVRMLSNRKSTSALTDAQVDFYVNNYYLYEFPQQFRSFDLRQEYVFMTQPNVDVYQLTPNTYTSFEPTCYVSGYASLFTQNRDTFHQMFPYILQNVYLTGGNGTIGPYSGTVSGTPFLKNNVVVSAQISFSAATSAVDNSDGLLYPVIGGLPSFNSPPIGTVNYQTGAISVSFLDIVPNGNEVRVQTRQYAANRPTTILYYDNQLIMRPVPDQAYEIKMITYVVPMALDGTNPNSLPILTEWWEVLAYGAAAKVYEDNKDLDSWQEMQMLLSRKLDLIGRRQWQELRTQRIQTIYSAPASPYGPYPFYGWFGQPW